MHVRGTERRSNEEASWFNLFHSDLDLARARKRETPKNAFGDFHI